MTKIEVLPGSCDCDSSSTRSASEQHESRDSVKVTRISLEIPHEGPQAAAALISVLAYPGRDEDEKWANCYQSMLAWHIRDKLRDRAWAASPQTIIPALLQIPARTVENTLNHALYRIKSHRLPAADMAGNLLVLTAFGKAGAVNKLAERTAVRLAGTPVGWGTGVAQDEQNWNRTNVLSRIWTPSKPVAHIALAFRNICVERFGSQAFRIIELFEGEWVARAVQQSEDYARALASTCPRSFSPEDFLWLRLRECGLDGGLVAATQSHLTPPTIET